MTTSAQIHGHPKLDWETHYAQSEIDQGHLKHVLKPRTPNTPKILPTPITTEPEITAMPPVKPDCESTALIGHVPNKKKVHWPQIFARIHYVATHNSAGGPTPPRGPVLKRVEQRTQATRRSKDYRDQIVDIVTTLHLQQSHNNGTEPQCHMYIRPRHMFHSKPTTDCRNYIAGPRKPITILQRPNKTEDKWQPTTPTYLIKFKTLKEKEENYARARAMIFARTEPKNPF